MFCVFRFRSCVFKFIDPWVGHVSLYVKHPNNILLMHIKQDLTFSRLNEISLARVEILKTFEKFLLKIELLFVTILQ